MYRIKITVLMAICLTLPMSAKQKKNQGTWAPRVDKPLVLPVSRPYTPKAGLQDRHIAMWQSHGWYYEQKLNRWEWQRGRLLQTVEDLYTQSYVLPFLVPMLENAGANVLLPRERDVCNVELVIDNDDANGTDGVYSEDTGWTDGGVGFAHRKKVYGDDDRPFSDGTFRQATTVRKGDVSVAKWTPVVPRKGEYAVYVSYRTVEGSAEDALYTVKHLGGETSFRVNQTMGGGTWIYLGTFLFDKGSHPDCCVTLSNISRDKGRIVTADAVKIGGGMGNIARNGQESGYPRFTEGARYWLQWAGAPDSVFTPFKGENDYDDDYCSRALWVNWLGGGSDVLPDREGLHVPLDMSFAFHTDAGLTKSDATIGTLMIYETETEGRTTYANGASRELAGLLADTIQKQILHDVRTLHEPTWNGRGMWNKAYFEARVPEVPAVLLELLSHQNFADMRYGLDPRFRFTVSRAIYKGILRFLSKQRRRKCVVQPLPVTAMKVRMESGLNAVVEWKPVQDSLESTATPDSYVVYVRKDDGGWDNGSLVEEPRYEMKLEKGHVYSWKVCALNDGGASFPGEILSAGIPAGWTDADGMAMVVNGFQRVSAPADFCFMTTDSVRLAGFVDTEDHGVPYIRDISYIGSQKEFRCAIPWVDDDATGFGDSYADYETQVIAGNTFDYPFIHGKALMSAGLAFVSCGSEALADSAFSLAGYSMVDLVLGKQCQTKMGNGKHHPMEFKTFPQHLQKALAKYLQADGGKLFASGAFIGTDLWANKLVDAVEEDKTFATEVLKYRWRAGHADRSGKIKSVSSTYSVKGAGYSYANTPNTETYVVEAPDAIEPACAEAMTTLRYSSNNLSAAVAYRGDDYATYIMGLPFESISGEDERASLMKSVLGTLGIIKN